MTIFRFYLFNVILCISKCIYTRKYLFQLSLYILIKKLSKTGLRYYLYKDTFYSSLVRTNNNFILHIISNFLQKYKRIKRIIRPMPVSVHKYR